MKWIGMLLVGLLINSVVKAAQSKETPQSSVSFENVKQKTREATGTTEDYVEQKKETYQKSITQELNDLDTKVVRLKAQSEQAGASTRVRLQQKIKDVEKKIKVARKNLEELKMETVERWENLRRGVDRAMADAKKSYDKVRTKLK